MLSNGNVYILQQLWLCHNLEGGCCLYVGSHLGSIVCSNFFHQASRDSKLPVICVFPISLHFVCSLVLFGFGFVAGSLTEAEVD